MPHKESLSKKLTFGIFYLLSSSIASLGLNVITVAFIARAFGVENFGLYSAIFSFVGLFQFLTDFGLNKTLLKFGSTDRVKAQISFGNALFVKSILVVPLLLIITFFGFFAGYRGEKIIILELFAISLIFDSYGTVFSSIRRILGSFKLISFFRVLRTAINLLVIILSLSIKNSVLSLAFAVMLLSFVIFIVSLTNTVLLLKPRLNLRLVRDFFKDSLVFSLSDFFLNVYARISIVLLSFFNDLHSVGIYSAALRFTRIANLLPTQIKFALLPTMYRMLEDKDKETDRKHIVGKSKEQKVFTMLLKYMVIFATPAVLSIYFFSDSIIHLVFGPKYDPSIPLVKLFSIFIYLRFIETPFSLFYIAMHKNKNMLYFQGSTSFLNVILNLILIPLFSTYGACVATLVSEMFLGFLLVFTGTKYLIWNLKEVFKTFLKPSVAGLLSLSLIMLLVGKVNILIQVMLLFICYFLFLLMMKIFDEHDKELFLKIFLNKRREELPASEVLDRL